MSAAQARRLIARFGPQKRLSLDDENDPGGLLRLGVLDFLERSRVDALDQLTVSRQSVDRAHVAERWSSHFPTVPYSQPPEI